MREPKTIKCIGCHIDYTFTQSRVGSRPKYFCFSCNSEARPLKEACKRYKISMNQAKESYSITNCENCGTTLTESTGPGSTTGTTRQIDHDHFTNEYRGVLCWDCNSGIGKLGDNEEGLLSALNYLRRKL